jgi:hypothetical protein
VGDLAVLVANAERVAAPEPSDSKAFFDAAQAGATSRFNGGHVGCSSAGMTPRRLHPLRSCSLVVTLVSATGFVVATACGSGSIVDPAEDRVDAGCARDGCATDAAAVSDAITLDGGATPKSGDAATDAFDVGNTFVHVDRGSEPFVHILDPSNTVSYAP